MDGAEKPYTVPVEQQSERNSVPTSDNLCDAEETTRSVAAALPAEDLDRETIQRVISGLTKLDAEYETKELDLHQLEEWLARERSSRKKRTLKDLSVFLSVAILLLFGATLLYMRLPAAFLSVQFAAVLFPILVYLFASRREHRGKRVNR